MIISPTNGSVDMDSRNIQEGSIPTRSVFTASIISAGLSASLVGFAGSVALNLEAARAIGATPEQTSSWVMVLCLGIAATSLFLSLRHRMPIPTAWSTPGAALIASTSVGVDMNQAIAAFLLSAVLVLATAFIGPLGRLMERLPKPLAAAMLAGILIRFCLDLVGAAEADPVLVLPLVVVFFLALRFVPGMAVLIVIFVGGLVALMGGMIAPDCCQLALSTPVWIAPDFQVPVLIGLGLPLYVVTMTTQNLSGLAVLKADGYAPSPKSCLGATGLVSLLVAPFGGHGVCLAAITTSICSGPSCHADPARRWMAGCVVGACYLVFAAFADSAIALLAALPAALITMIVGTALFAPFQASIKAALRNGPSMDRAALATFIVAASGVSFLGIGSALWGLFAGLAIYAMSDPKSR